MAKQDTENSSTNLTPLKSEGVPDAGKSLGTKDQIKQEYPNLNDKQVDRYAKLMDKEAAKTPSNTQGKSRGVEI